MDRSGSASQRCAVCTLLGYCQPSPLHRVGNIAYGNGVVANCLSSNRPDRELVRAVAYGTRWKECGVVHVGYGEDIRCWIEDREWKEGGKQKEEEGRTGGRGNMACEARK